MAICQYRPYKPRPLLPQTDPHRARQEKVDSLFACQFETLRSGTSWIWKQFQNSESLRILELSSDSWYSISKCLKLASKLNWLLPATVRICVMPEQKMLIQFACHFQVSLTGTQSESTFPGRCEDLCNAWTKKSWFTLCASSRHLEVEY
jgi:hypothetical protein